MYQELCEMDGNHAKQKIKSSDFGFSAEVMQGKA